MAPSQTVDKIPTGIRGLDEILLGGVSRGNLILVEGGPGTGKTTLGLEFIFRGARELHEPGVVVCFELSPEKLFRDASGFGWDLEGLARAGTVQVVYTSPAVILDDLQSPDGVLAAQIKQLGAKRVLIDGLTPLRLYGERMSGRPFRDSLHILVESLQRYGVTAMITNELGPETGAEEHRGGHERFVCDTILHLDVEGRRRSLKRTLEIVKSRGQDFIGGKHTLKITADAGIQIFRRAQSRPKGNEQQPTSTKRSTIGIKAVDELLGGGLYDGSVSLVAGISGTGKTVLGMNFLMSGVAAGKKGLLVTLDEHPRQLARNAETLGFELSAAVDRGDVEILYDSPLEVELDVHFDAIVRAIEKRGAQRIVLDSIAAYEAASPEEASDFIYALATFLKNKNLTALFNYESPELLGVSQISEDIKVSHLVDNIILLNLVEISNQLRRAISIPKVRGSRNIQKTREFIIGEGGIHLVPEPPGSAEEKLPQLPFSAYTGLLSRSPARHSPLLSDLGRSDGGGDGDGEGDEEDSPEPPGMGRG